LLLYVILIGELQFTNTPSDFEPTTMSTMPPRKSKFLTFKLFLKIVHKYKAKFAKQHIFGKILVK